MCSSATLELIREVVDDKINKDEAFTAFDISCDVKQLAQQRDLPSERHQDMKDEIHNSISQFVSQGLYCRQLCDVGAPTKAFVYYPANGYDPANYTPRPRNDGKKVKASAQLTTPTVTAPAATVTAPAPATTAATVPWWLADTDDEDDDGDEKAVDRTPDARGTLCIPNHITRAAGLKAKDLAYASKAPAQLVLSKTVAPGLTKLTSYTVDLYENIRITQSTLQACGLAGPKYDFVREGDKIYVTDSQD